MCVCLPTARTQAGEAGNSPRQLLPPVFVQDSCIDVVRASTILERRSMTGGTNGRVLGLVLEESVDIDTEDDFRRAKRQRQQQQQRRRRRRQDAEAGAAAPTVAAPTGRGATEENCAGGPAQGNSRGARSNSNRSVR